MWGAAAIPQPVGPGAGFTFADPTPVMGMPAPGLAPVAPVIPGNVAPVPAASGALTTAAPNGPGAAPAGPQPVIPGQEGGRVRNAISRGREALGRVRERVSTPGSRGYNFVSDFAAGVSQPNEGRPLAAFLQGFAGAIGSSRGRAAAEAEAAAAAEERAYQRSRDAIEDARADRGEDRADRTLTLAERRAEQDAKIERERLAAENERNRLLNAKTAAEIAEMDRAAGGFLTGDDIHDINQLTINDYNARRAAVLGNGFVPLTIDQLDQLDAEALRFKTDLTEQYLLANGYTLEEYNAALGRGGATPAATGAAAPAAAGPAATAPVTLPAPLAGVITGDGTEARPLTGAAVNPSNIGAIAAMNRGRDIYYVDPATRRLMVVTVP